MYATVDNMVANFGLREVIALSDRDNTGEKDDAVIDNGLDTAASEIDTYLAGRYALPLDPPPKVLTGVCCDIARYRLCGAGTSNTEEITSRYKAAIAFLKLVASGDVTLGATSAGAIPQPDNSVQFISGSRVFSRDARR